MSLSVCLAAQQQAREEKVNLRATVRDVAPLMGFSGTVTPVDSDPRFALTLWIESVTGTTNLAARSVITFAVHSPSKLFVGEPVKGKSYDFEVLRKIEHGKVSFSVLQLRKTAVKKGASLDVGGGGSV